MIGIRVSSEIVFECVCVWTSFRNFWKKQYWESRTAFKTYGFYLSWKFLQQLIQNFVQSEPGRILHLSESFR